MKLLSVDSFIQLRHSGEQVFLLQEVWSVDAMTAWAELDASGICSKAVGGKGSQLSQKQILRSKAGKYHDSERKRMKLSTSVHRAEKGTESFILCP